MGKHRKPLTGFTYTITTPEQVEALKKYLSLRTEKEHDMQEQTQSEQAKAMIEGAERALKTFHETAESSRAKIQDAANAFVNLYEQALTKLADNFVTVEPEKETTLSTPQDKDDQQQAWANQREEKRRNGMFDQITMTTDKLRELLTEDDQQLRTSLESYLPRVLPRNVQGLWAKYEGEDVLIASEPDECGEIWYSRKGDMVTASRYAHLDELTFPEQATKPEDVPIGEAWLVKHHYQDIVALKHIDGHGEGRWTGLINNGRRQQFHDREITLVSPLKPPTPTSPRAPEPRVLRTEEDYRDAETLTVVMGDAETAYQFKQKRGDGNWYGPGYAYAYNPRHMSLIGESTVIWEPGDTNA